MDDATLSAETQAGSQASSLGDGRYEDPTPPEFAGEAPRKSKRRQTAHLKLVPQDKPLRETLQAASKNDSKRSAVDQKIGDYWSACMDESGIQSAGILG